MVRKEKVERFVRKSRRNVLFAALAAGLLWLAIGIALARNDPVGCGIFLFLTGLIGYSACRHLADFYSSENDADAALGIRGPRVLDEKSARENGGAVYWALLYELADKAGLPEYPRAIISPETEITATIYNPQYPFARLLEVSRGAIERLTPGELRAAIAHELAHCEKEDDIRLTDFAIGVIVVFFGSFCWLLLVLKVAGVFFGDFSVLLSPSLLGVLAISALFAYVIGPRMRTYVSKESEYRADARGCLLAGSAEDFETLLRKIDGTTFSAKSLSDKVLTQREKNLHPSPERRIRAIRKL